MNYSKEIEIKITNSKNDLENIKSLEELKQLRPKYFKSDILKELINEISQKDTSLVDKKRLGNLLKSYNQIINFAFSKRENELENSFFLIDKPNELFLDIQMDLSPIEKTNQLIIHPLSIVENDIKNFFENNNYEFLYGNEVEEEKFNFDILNMPEGHTARSMHDTLYFKGGMLLRTHSTNITARRLMKSKSNTNFFFSVGNVFRNDDNDATHSFQFKQVDFFATSDESISIANLKSLLDLFLQVIFEKKIETRYRISYFPFTEPSFEVDIKFMSKKVKEQK